jgi:hypothetical protein
MTREKDARYEFFLELFRRYTPKTVTQLAGPAMQDFAALLRALSGEMTGVSTITITPSIGKTLFSDDWVATTTVPCWLSEDLYGVATGIDTSAATGYCDAQTVTDHGDTTSEAQTHYSKAA